MRWTEHIVGMERIYFPRSHVWNERDCFPLAQTCSQMGNRQAAKLVSERKSERGRHRCNLIEELHCISLHRLEWNSIIYFQFCRAAASTLLKLLKTLHGEWINSNWWRCSNESWPTDKWFNAAGEWLIETTDFLTGSGKHSIQQSSFCGVMQSNFTYTLIDITLEWNASPVSHSLIDIVLRLLEVLNRANRCDGKESIEEV